MIFRAFLGGAALNGSFVYAKNLNDLISKVSNLRIGVTCTLFAESQCVYELTKTSTPTIGKGIVSKMTNNLFDLTFSFNSGRGFLSGRFDINTNDFQFNTYALKSDLGNTNNIQLMQAHPDNIDDPPLAIILQAHKDLTLGNLPTEIGGSVFLILQSNPTIQYKQFNSQLAIGFGSDKIAFRRRSGGDWTAWKYLTFS